MDELVYRVRHWLTSVKERYYRSRGHAVMKAGTVKYRTAAAVAQWVPSAPPDVEGQRSLPTPGRGSASDLVPAAAPLPRSRRDTAAAPAKRGTPGIKQDQIKILNEYADLD